jgi:ABC-type transport system substrate-binding protein
MRQAKPTRIVMWVFLMTVIAAIIAVGCGSPGNGNGYEPPVEPQYGGILRNSVMEDPEGFDDAVEAHHATGTLKLTNEEVWTGDWAKGYAGGDGTDESPWTLGGGLNRLEHKTGALAENVSWTPDMTTITLDIRPDVHWHNKLPTNGREVTAEDVAYSLERQYTDPGAYMKQTYPDTCAATNISVDGNKVILEIDDPQYFPNVIDNLDSGLHVHLPKGRIGGVR